MKCYEKTWKNLKCTLRSEKNQPEKVINCMIPAMTLWKGKTMKTVKRSMLEVGEWWRRKG